MSGIRCLKKLYNTRPFVRRSVNCSTGGRRQSRYKYETKSEAQSFTSIGDHLPFTVENFVINKAASYKHSEAYRPWLSSYTPSLLGGLIQGLVEGGHPTPNFGWLGGLLPDQSFLSDLSWGLPSDLILLTVRRALLLVCSGALWDILSVLLWTESQIGVFTLPPFSIRT